MREMGKGGEINLFQYHLSFIQNFRTVVDLYMNNNNRMNSKLRIGDNFIAGDKMITLKILSC